LIAFNVDCSVFGSVCCVSRSWCLPACQFGRIYVVPSSKKRKRKKKKKKNSKKTEHIFVAKTEQRAKKMQD
jgi:hypothetical protein